ncbi:CDP-alcohol phosphatidyltransferase family protein, partial [Streptomyces sp. NPDC057052]
MSTAILTGQPVPGSSIEADLRSLGFDVRTAADAADTETLLAAVPADQRVAVVDTRFVGHRHALRLGLTDPRFPLAAVPGAVTAQPAGRQALTRAMARENSASGGTAVAVDSLADRIATALDADGSEVHRPE